jgi:glycosyltransferase involved in cell wall biosynthesis
VIMPTYEGSRYLRHALDSIVCQRDDAIEVVVIDDGSRDDTLAIAESYRTRLSLTVIALRHGGNWVANVNHGIQAARGTYLSILHQDDAWHHKRLAKLKELIAQDPGAAMFVHPCWYMDSAGRKIGYWRCPFPRRTTVIGPQKALQHLIVQCLYAMPAPMFRAVLAHEVGRMDETLWFSADWDLWLKLTRLGDTLYCPTPLAMFRLHPASQTISRGRQSGEIYRQQMTVLDRYMGSIGDASCAAEVCRTARLSAEVNAALLRFLDGEAVGAFALAMRLLGLGPGGWRRYFRDSRVVERCLSRVQAGAISWRGGWRMISEHCDRQPADETPRRHLRLDAAILTVAAAVNMGVT